MCCEVFVQGYFFSLLGNRLGKQLVWPEYVNFCGLLIGSHRFIQRTRKPCRNVSAVPQSFEPLIADHSKATKPIVKSPRFCRWVCR